MVGKATFVDDIMNGERSEETAAMRRATRLVVLSV
jgi:hypothetical protein